MEKDGYEYSGRLGANKMKCRLCNEHFDVPTDLDGKELSNFDDSKLIRHYEDCHPEHMIDNRLVPHTGKDNDNSWVLIDDKNGCFYFFILRPHKQSDFPQPVEEVEREWRTLASNVSFDNVGNYIEKRLDEFKDNGVDISDIMLRLDENERGNVSVEYGIRRARNE